MLNMNWRAYASMRYVSQCTRYSEIYDHVPDYRRQWGLEDFDRRIEAEVHRRLRWSSTYLSTSAREGDLD